MPYLLDVTPAKSPIVVTLPDGSTISSTHTALLNLPELPAAARRCHVFPALSPTGSLLSIGQLCDQGCHALYDKDTVSIFHGNKLILQGLRSPVTRLWMVDLSPNNVAATVISNESQAKTVAFLHAALGSPVVSTLIAAIDKGFVDWPALTTTAVRRNLPTSIATAKGHLDQTRQGQRSTKKKQQQVNAITIAETTERTVSYHHHGEQPPSCRHSHQHSHNSENCCSYRTTVYGHARTLSRPFLSRLRIHPSYAQPGR